MNIKPFNWVYEHLICEFSHWDVCLTGLVACDGERLLCRVRDELADDVEYELLPVAWNDECEEYLNDYYVAYRHWFHENGSRPRYDGRGLSWFSDKWKGCNPIAEAAGVKWK